MSVEQKRSLGHRWAELWNAPMNLSLVDEFVAPDFVSHSAPPGLAPGSEGLKQLMAIFHAAFPDVYSVVEDVVVEGDRVVERWSAGGTHQGDFFGIPPTGKQMVTTGINIFRVENGKIAEHWSNGDDLGVFRQLGIVSM